MVEFKWKPTFLTYLDNGLNLSKEQKDKLKFEEHSFYGDLLKEAVQ